MRKLFLIVSASLFLISCSIGDDFPRIENIRKGNKWTLRIGSTPAEVYAQLQELNKEKKVERVEIVGRKDFLKPEEVRDIISLYDYLGPSAKDADDKTDQSDDLPREAPKGSAHGKKGQEAACGDIEHKGKIHGFLLLHRNRLEDRNRARARSGRPRLSGAHYSRNPSASIGPPTEKAAGRCPPPSEKTGFVPRKRRLSPSGPDSFRPPPF